MNEEHYNEAFDNDFDRIMCSKDEYCECDECENR